MLVVLVLWASIGGSGKHFKTLTVHERTLFFKIFLSNELIYVLASPAIKLSIIFFYRRIFTVPKFRRASAVVIALTAAWAIAIFKTFHCSSADRWPSIGIGPDRVIASMA